MVANGKYLHFAIDVMLQKSVKYLSNIHSDPPIFISVFLRNITQH